MGNPTRKMTEDNSTENWFQVDIPSLHDRQKALERLITNQVESSALAGYRGDHDTALRDARKAQDTFESLKVAQAQELRSGSAISSGSSPDESSTVYTNPVTTACNLFELMLMVKSNLAVQLGRADRDEEALEIFTQLGRLANADSNNMGGFTVASGQLDEMRLILYKFGLEVGNSLFKMGHYQRSLKYYRLTLDRLPTSMYQNLRIKIMSNIVAALIKLNWLENGSSKSMGMSSSSAHLNSMRLLLADNVKQHSHSGKVCNANHHRFGLNLIIAQLESSDLRGALKTIEMLIKTDISEHFFRMDYRATAKLSLHPDEYWPKLLKTKAETNNRIHSGSSSSSSSKSIASVRTVINDNEMTINDDPLHDVIIRREAQVRRALILGCALVSDHGNKMRANNQGEQVDLVLLELEQKSLLNYCARLLGASSSYSLLRYELQMNCALDMLSNSESSFERGVQMLHGVRKALQHERRQRVTDATKQRVQLIDSGFMTSKSSIQPNQPIKQLLVESTHVQANISVISSLFNENQDNSALVEAIARQKDSAAYWLNLAHFYHRQTGDQMSLNNVALCLKQALTIDPRHWQANYNWVILNRVDGVKASADLHKSRLAQSIAGLLTENHLQPLVNSLIFKGLLLEITQSLACSAILQQVRRGKLLNLIRDMINTHHCLPPELFLMISRLISADNTEQAEASLSPISVLISASKVHQYHLPLMERIIAHYISAFDYRSAERLIEVCAKLRPDQAKWHRMLAECCLRESNYQRAMVIYGRAVSRFPFDVSCLKAMTKLAKDLGLSKEFSECQARLEKLKQFKIN